MGLIAPPLRCEPDNPIRRAEQDPAPDAADRAVVRQWRCGRRCLALGPDLLQPSLCRLLRSARVNASGRVCRPGATGKWYCGGPLDLPFADGASGSSSPPPRLPVLQRPLRPHRRLQLRGMCG